MNDDVCLDEDRDESRWAGDPVLAFRLACADEHYKGKWRECAYRGCRARRRCTGGPRGTFSKLARPLCWSDGKEIDASLERPSAHAGSAREPPKVLSVTSTGEA